MFWHSLNPVTKATAIRINFVSPLVTSVRGKNWLSCTFTTYLSGKDKTFLLPSLIDRSLSAGQLDLLILARCFGRRRFNLCSCFHISFFSLVKKCICSLSRWNKWQPLLIYPLNVSQIDFEALYFRAIPKTESLSRAWTPACVINSPWSLQLCHLGCNFSRHIFYL